MKIRDLINHNIIPFDLDLLLKEVGSFGVSKKIEQNIFSFETIDSLSELGSVLGRIRARVIKEGYIIKDGKITKNEKQK